MPAGFVIENGEPHVAQGPYADLTLYNPQSLSIQANYTGFGWLQMWAQGLWMTVGTLAAG